MKPKRKRAPKRNPAPATSVALAEPRPPPATMGDASAYYVRVPLPPPILDAVARYHAIGSDLAGLVVRASEAATDFLASLEAARIEVERDAERLRRYRKRRR